MYARDERAERHDLEPFAARVLERGRDEPAAEAAAFERLVDLRVREGDPAVPAPVGGLADHPAAVA